MHAPLVRTLPIVVLAAGLAAGFPALTRAQTTPPPAGGGAPASTAPSPSTLADIQRAEAVSITATRIEEPLERVGASVSVVPDEVIEVQQYRSVDEALRSLPGLNVQTSGSPGKLTTVSIRGANASQIQAALDGGPPMGVSIEALLRSCAAEASNAPAPYCLPPIAYCL